MPEPLAQATGTRHHARIVSKDGADRDRPREGDRREAAGHRGGQSAVAGISDLTGLPFAAAALRFI
jgi:hypothetical protein